MPPQVTRTTHPLPFQELEPHRFEDLVRQLAYEWRSWKSLEATGRGGSDEGIDIRGVEHVVVEPPGQGGQEPEQDAEAAESACAAEERLWVFQCKRERTMAAGAIQKAVKESLRSLSAPPYGFVLVVAGDVSKKARDAFRDEVVARRISEWALWARGELEDMLYQARYDRLLFAYFGISLQPRRRSAATAVRTQVTRKKQLRALLEPERDSRPHAWLLLRDPLAEAYPPLGEAPGSHLRTEHWQVCEYEHLQHPGMLAVVARRHLAWLSSDGQRWDALREEDVLDAHAAGYLRSRDSWLFDRHPPAQDDGRVTAHAFWGEYVPRLEQAYLEEVRLVPLERIVAIDGEGDGYFPMPQLLVERAEGGFFHPSLGMMRVVTASHSDRRSVRAEKHTRLDYFPTKLPDTLFPPPPTFNRALPPEAAALSARADAHLQSLLASQSAQRAEAARQRTSAVGTPPPAVEAPSVAAFRVWRDTVALPVFSAVQHRLLAAGERARVDWCSASSPAASPSEAVELKFELRAVAPYEPREYWASGYLRFELKRWSGQWEVEQFPADGGSGQSPAGRPSDRSPLDAPTPLPSRDALEAWVLELLGRTGRK